MCWKYQPKVWTLCISCVDWHSSRLQFERLQEEGWPWEPEMLQA